MRRLNPTLAAKFTDFTRHFIPAPLAYREVELWVEKDSIRNFLRDLAAKYRLSLQVLRGFASLSMYRAAIQRAEKRGVKKILYVGDFGPSGLLIDRIAEEEMGIKVHRIALTMEQRKRSSRYSHQNTASDSEDAEPNALIEPIMSSRPVIIHSL